MKKPKMFRKVICFIIALLMMTPSLPGNTVSAAEIVNNDYVTVNTKNSSSSSGSRTLKTEVYLNDSKVYEVNKNFHKNKPDYGPGAVTVSEKSGYTLSSIKVNERGGTGDFTEFTNGTVLQIEWNKTRTMRIYLETAEPEDPPTEEDIILNKTATAVDGQQNTYEVQLSVLGENLIIPQKADVVLVLDNSNSMHNEEDDDGNSLAEITRDAAHTFIDEVLTGSNNGNIRVAVVQYGTKARARQFSGGDWTSNWSSGLNLSGVSVYTSDNSAAKSAVTGATTPFGRPDYQGNYTSSDGGTNTEGGFLMAQKIAGQKRGDAESIVIFMTDGMPTYRYDGNNTAYDSYGDQTSDRELNEAIAAAQALDAGDAGSDIYTVALLSAFESTSNQAKLAENLLSTSPKTYKFEANNVMEDVNDPDEWEDAANYTQEYYPIFSDDDASEEMEGIYEELADTVNALATGYVTDVIPAYFQLTAQSIEDLELAGATITPDPDGTTTITYPNVTASATIQNLQGYTVVAKPGYYGTAYTNKDSAGRSAIYHYTLNTPEGGTGEEDFPQPVVPINPTAIDDPSASGDHYTAYSGVTLDVNPEDGILKNDGIDADNILYDGGYTISELKVLPDYVGEEHKIVTDDGTVVIQEDGSFVFTPTAGFTGLYTFTYKNFIRLSNSGSDGLTGDYESNLATVAINVLPPVTANFTVEHYLQNSDGTTYPSTATHTETFSGNTGTTVYDDDYDNSYAGWTYASGAVDAITSAVIAAPDGTTVLKLYYTVDEIDFTVNYYKDSVTEANKLGTTGGTAEFGSGITIAAGTDEGQLNWKKPTGYQGGVQQGTVPYVIQVSGNVIDVLYLKDSFGYTVNYYKDSIGEANFLDDETGTGTFGDEITADLTLYAPTGYITPGTRSGATHITAVAADNVVNVVYVKDSFGYTVEYYADDTTGTPLGTDSFTATFGDEITDEDISLTAYAPTGYATPGTSDAPLTITEVAANNVIKVVYEKATFGYTVEYYQDSVTGTLLGTDSFTATFGDEITDEDISLTAYAPTGYATPGTSDAPLTITEVAADNVIKVIYEKGSYGYTINYYKNSVTEENLVGTTSGTALFGSGITLTAEQLNAYKPAGYQDGVQQGTVPYVIQVSGNAINVLYVKDSNATIEIPVSKRWIDGQEYDAPSSVQRPDSIVLYLVDGNGDDTDYFVTLSDENGWRGEFTLPKYDGNNVEIDYSGYTVREEALDDYISEVESWLTEEDFSDGFGVYNIEALNVPVTKVWEGPAGDEVTIELLYPNGEVTGNVLTLDGNNYWSDSFKLAKYEVVDGEGSPIDYTGYSISEIEVEGYDTEITGSVEEGFTVTNTANSVEYTVNYLESGTDKQLANSVTKTGIFGTEVTEKAIDIKDYNKVGPTEKTITLGVSGNVINFYYTVHEVIDGTDYYDVKWMYETGYNTEDYNERYADSGEGAPESIQHYVDLHYDSGYTYTTYKTWTEDKEVEVVVDVDVTSGSAITGSAVTGTAIRIETTTFIELFYDRDRTDDDDDDDDDGDRPTTIPDTEVPLAELEKFDHFAYVIGYPDGEVKPMNNITREEVAMIFYRLLTDESRNGLLSDTNPFTDLEGHGWSNRAISTLYNAGIIKGYPDGTFRPSEPITRAEFATIAAKFDKLELENTTKFTDIFGHWAEKYITSSEIKGWIKGYPDLTFKPEQDITRAEAMTLINNVLDRAVPEENIHPDAIFWPDMTSDDWYYEAVMEATNSHDYIYEEDGDELWTGMKANKVWP